MTRAKYTEQAGQGPMAGVPALLGTTWASRPSVASNLSIQEMIRTGVFGRKAGLPVFLPVDRVIDDIAVFDHFGAEVFNLADEVIADVAPIKTLNEYQHYCSELYRALDYLHDCKRKEAVSHVLAVLHLLDEYTETVGLPRGPYPSPPAKRT